MSKRIAIITVHGMGRVAEAYDAELVRRLRGSLGERATDVHFERVYYKDLLLGNENRVWDMMKAGLRWSGLRRFFLFAFSDAASLESSKGVPHGIYWQTQVRLARALLHSRDAMGGNGPVIVVAHSLGCEVASCYFWDAGARACSGSGVDMAIPATAHVTVHSIWKDFGEAVSDIAAGRAQLSAAEVTFLRGSHLRLLVTTGCNIPVFVAAHATDDICPISTGPQFRWHNYYSRFDPLGWPLAGLSSAYAQVVTDHCLMPCAGLRNTLLFSWNPGCHLLYWSSARVVNAIGQEVAQLMT